MNFDISIMGVSALRSHAKGKKHQARAPLSKVQSVGIRHFASNKENANDCGEPVPPTASATSKTYIVGAEIRWCFCMGNCHSSYNSCADLVSMFQVMFPDSKIVSQFTLGKTKA